MSQPPSVAPSHAVEFQPLIDELKNLYRTKLLPIEQLFHFDQFFSPFLTDTDLDSKPMVLLIGQYSTGKTSFIRYLLERDFPGANIGPEPTTDRFVAVMYNRDERIIPGNALAAAADKPFTALNKFGMGFLNKFEASMCASPILEKITFVDTPGVLSGEKQRMGRTYQFSEIVEWFAERCDRILLLFDAHKLDISDEFKAAIESLRGHDDKTRVILNKADMPTQNLLRVYGALMWSLGKVMKTPEVPKVYMGSFWDQPLKHLENEKLLQLESQDLLADLRGLPRNSAVRKINELVKRARLAKVHAHICNHLRKQFGLLGKESTQKKLLEQLSEEFGKVQHETGLPAGDFPNVHRYRETLAKFEIWNFKKLDKKLLPLIDEALSVDIPRILKMIPDAEEHLRQMTQLYDAAQRQNDPSFNPFAFNADRAEVQSNWDISQAFKNKCDNEFYSLDPGADGKLPGSKAKTAFQRSALSNVQLRQIWSLADMDGDGQLDAEEYAVAMFIIEQFKTGAWPEIPQTLPVSAIPPARRQVPDN